MIIRTKNWINVSSATGSRSSGTWSYVDTGIAATYLNDGSLFCSGATHTTDNYGIQLKKSGYTNQCLETELLTQSRNSFCESG